MNKNYCVNFEKAKILNKAGWKKETEFYWVLNEYNTWIILDNHNNYKQYYSAPISDEIIEALQHYLITIETDIDNYRVIFDGDFYEEFNDESLADALAEMWVYLKKKVVESGL